MSTEIVFATAGLLLVFFIWRVVHAMRNERMPAPQRAMYRVTLVILIVALLALVVAVFRQWWMAGRLHF